MKNTLLAFLVLAGSILSFQVDAQTFTLTAGDTVNTTVSAGLNKIYNRIKNVSSNSITVSWKITDHDLPASWSGISAEFGICDNVICYSNSGNNLINGSTQTMLPIVPADEGDFHVQINLDGLAPATHFLKVNFKEGLNSKDAVFILTKSQLGVTNVSRSDDDIVLFPNPARDNINAVFNDNLNVKTISVHNMIGKMVSIYKVANNSAKLDVADLPAGVYFLRIGDGNGRVIATRKFTHQ